MQTYLVGGAVRDMLLGFDPKDKDYVVVGSTENEMFLAGFEKVGADFPVFLHPETKDEYALARTEISTGKGYNDFTVAFDPSVTLDDDLSRRDLTINAMAIETYYDETFLYDPFGGNDDLNNKILRHVGPAFMDDPVRILRVARFAARFGPEWKVAESTKALMRQMVQGGMVDNLTSERVWKETSRALTEKHPRLFFDVLNQCGGLVVIFPELKGMKSVEENVKYHPEGNTYEHTMLVLEAARKLTNSLPVLFAALTHDFGKLETDPAKYPAHHGHENKGAKLIEQFALRLATPTKVRKDAMAISEQHMKMKWLSGMKPTSIAKMFKQMGAYANEEIVEKLILVAKADARGKLGHETDAVVHFEKLADMFNAAKSVKFMEELEKLNLVVPPTREAAANFMHQRRVIAIRKVGK